MIGLEERRMDWVKQLNESINYIEKNLTGEISYETISKITGCSIDNFQRMFSYIADKPLAEYIRSRRLTMAAFELLNSTERIIDISLKYGYESQDSFTRAI
jgi:AraC family transcriptional regulator